LNSDLEEWRSAPNTRGALEVSNFGRVRSINRTISFTDTKPDRDFLGQILKTSLDGCGYLSLKYSVCNQGKTVRVHRLVAEAFIPNPENKPQVNHINGDKQDNRVCNLEWATNSENVRHANSIGLRSYGFGQEACRFTGKVEAYDSSGRLVVTLAGNKEMAEHGFDFRLVSACLMGKRKTHKGCTFVKLN
jgi:hypothetical protein